MYNIWVTYGKLVEYSVCPCSPSISPSSSYAHSNNLKDFCAYSSYVVFNNFSFLQPLQIQFVSTRILQDFPDEELISRNPKFYFNIFCIQLVEQKWWRFALALQLGDGKNHQDEDAIKQVVKITTVVLDITTSNKQKCFEYCTHAHTNTQTERISGVPDTENDSWRRWWL